MKHNNPFIKTVQNAELTRFSKLYIIWVPKKGGAIVRLKDIMKDKPRISKEVKELRAELKEKEVWKSRDWPHRELRQTYTNRVWRTEKQETAYSWRYRLFSQAIKKAYQQEYDGSFCGISAFVYFFLCFQT